MKNCVVWAAQILCGNAILGYSVVFLEAAGFSELQAFDVNISLSACYIIGGIICWFMFPHLGRSTIYMGGLTFMFFCLIAIGGLGWAHSKDSQLAIGILLVISTLCNMITIGPACYPIVAETPSGRLRYKTIVIGRFVYNLTGIFSNSVTPRMISSLCKFGILLTSVASTNSPIAWNWGAKTGLFYAGTNLLCNIWCWFRLPETKDRTFGEIDLMFENRVPARKFKHTKVDRKCHALSRSGGQTNQVEQNSLLSALMRKRRNWTRRTSTRWSIEQMSRRARVIYSCSLSEYTHGQSSADVECHERAGRAAPGSRGNAWAPRRSVVAIQESVSTQLAVPTHLDRWLGNLFALFSRPSLTSSHDSNCLKPSCGYCPAICTSVQTIIQVMVLRTSTDGTFSLSTLVPKNFGTGTSVLDW